jgi:hypothetical protein
MGSAIACTLPIPANKIGSENNSETTESSGENGVTSSNEVNHIPAATEPEISEESG